MTEGKAKNICEMYISQSGEERKWGDQNNYALILKLGLQDETSEKLSTTIRASVDALCRDGTSESHVIRVQNAFKLGEKA